MKKFVRTLSVAVAICSIWIFGLTLFANYRIKTRGVSPQFPYYNTLLKEASKNQAVWGYFDGTHYLHLAEYGYDSTGTQAFFPVYPLLIRAVHNIFNVGYFQSAQAISVLFLILSIVGIKYLLPKGWIGVTVALLLFPVSFFLASLYTESLFLFLTLLFFLLLQKKHFVLASGIAAVASATRLVGVFLAVSLVVEYLQMVRNRKKNQHVDKIDVIYGTLLFLVGISGIGLYMAFLWRKFGDPLMFIHVQGMFGAERSSDRIILLPQVLYRYARMVTTIDVHSFLYQRVWLELGIFVGAVYLALRNIRKIPASWSIYSISSLLLPTLTGTLSSMPRYVLMVVPMLFAPYAKKNLWLIPLCISLLALLLYLFWVHTGGEFVA